MTMITITLRQIMENNPCYDPREKGNLPADHDLDAEMTFGFIAERALDPDDVVWCFSVIPRRSKLQRQFARECAARVAHLAGDNEFPTAQWSVSFHAQRAVTLAELAADGNAAYYAARAAVAAADDSKAERAWQVGRVLELTGGRLIGALMRMEKRC
jgi:hypothetical protein